ncbi:NAD(P)-binding protein [Nannocystis bainbridge]|uniref:NAD(P)-binding protein n=1 Tax=Nannocystis bainbridge TaxID=2995303 RepID=A0ABT5E5K2_9BACT|nr:NAD(P)-binding protein [Nannocystis bainbridge]MDC0721129.1 NAD(P)-binding protein [Nannocystis bainbridge]
MAINVLDGSVPGRYTASMSSTIRRRTAARVLVSGASISGLTLAYWLSRYGFDVTVVERAPYLRPGGHALDVRGPALAVAARMGILSTLRDRSTKLTGISVVDSPARSSSAARRAP